MRSAVANILACLTLVALGYLTFRYVVWALQARTWGWVSALLLLSLGAGIWGYLDDRYRQSHRRIR